MSASGITGTGSQPTVLVVDDEAITRSLVARKVQQLGARTIEAEDGSIAWQRLQVETVHLAIVDLEMPNVDGFELLKCMREHSPTKDIPVVVLTSHEDAAAIEHAVLAGATSYLTKPLKWSMFGEHIRHLLNLSTVASAAKTSLLCA
jgi:CheY-like chemotaxis protein